MAVVGNGSSGNISISNIDSTKTMAGFNYCIPVTPSIIITASATTICAGSIVNFNSASVNGGSLPTYQWTINGNNVAGANSSTYSYAPTDGDNVTCILSANNTCQTSSTATSVGVAIAVTQNVTPNVSIIASATSICNNTSVTFTATPTNAGSSPIYNFSVNGNTVQNGSSSTYIYAPNNGDNVTCLLTANNTCQTTNTATSNSITEHILLPTTSTTDTTICTTTLPYTWNGVNFASAGNYSIHLTNAAGCDSIATLNLSTSTCTPNFIWTGANSTDWNDATNWSNNVLPIATNSVSIPSSPIHQPVLTSLVEIAGINLAGSLSLNGQKLILNGKLFGSGIIKSTANSQLAILSDTSTLNFDSTANTIGTLSLYGGSITIGNALSIINLLEGNSGAILNTQNNLILASTANGTAVTSNLTGVIINGRTTIQRYIPKGYAAFRDLGVAVSGAGTIAQTWGQSLSNYTSYSYNAVSTPSWFSIPDTISLKQYHGYRVLVNGYKNPVLPTKGTSFMNSDVTLSYSGNLLIGNQNIPLAAGINKFSFISNPYPSQVDFSKLSATGLFDGYWYLSPTIIDSNYENYNYYGTNLGLSNIYANNASKYLQPGQAFFVCSNSTMPSLTFTESSKNNTNVQSAIFGISNDLNRIALGLFSNGENLDGAVVVFNNNFSKSIAHEDGYKINNQGENLTFKVSGTDLCANGLSLPAATDELAIHLYQLQASKSYTLRLDVSQFQGNGLNAFLKDNKLNTKTPLLGDSAELSFKTATTNDTTFSNRYSIVFAPSTLPVSSIELITTTLNNNQVVLKWSVLGKDNNANFIVQHSVNGSDFSDLATIANTSINKYQFLDENMYEGVNYYRIKAVNTIGTTVYSNTATLITHNSSLITLKVAPNPVQDKLNITLTNINSNNYKLRILTIAGIEAFNKTEVTANNSMISLPVSNLAAGVYLLELADAQGNKSIKQFVKK